MTLEYLLMMYTSHVTSCDTHMSLYWIVENLCFHRNSYYNNKQLTNRIAVTTLPIIQWIWEDHVI